MHARIAITGIGILTSAGKGIEPLRNTLMEGISHTRKIDSFDTSKLTCQVGAPVLDFSADDYLNRHEIKRLDRSAQLFVASGMMAINDSGIFHSQADPDRIGIFEGSSLGGLHSALSEHETLIRHGPRFINPLLINKAMSGIGGSMLALRNEIHGPVVNFSNGSVSSANAIIAACQQLQIGEIDHALAGGCEAPVNYHMYSIFGRAGILCTLSGQENSASRPFDLSRKGLVLAEGAAVLSLERLDTAEKRGARIYGEICSTAMTNDSESLVAPGKDAAQQSRAMVMALDKAGMQPLDIDFISAHGTSTQLNDLTETLAIRKAFGACTESVPVTAVKSMLGHSLGACTAIELVCAALAIEHQFIPPVINLHHPDPQCSLNWVRHRSIQKPVRAALIKNSSFGGKNTVIIIKQYPASISNK